MTPPSVQAATKRLLKTLFKNVRAKCRFCAAPGPTLDTGDGRYLRKLDKAAKRHYATDGRDYWACALGELDWKLLAEIKKTLAET